MIFVRVAFFLLAIFVESEREISANSCFSVAGTIQELNACFEKGFPGDNTLSDAQWERMLPDEEEMKNYQALIKTVLRGGRGGFCNNKVLALYPSISNYIDLRHFQGHFCVIYERNVDPETGYFLRSWGYVVVADDVWSRRDLHHSAPHFQSDGNVLNESAAIFERTKSRTLVIAGASRYAVKGSKSTCQSEYSATDCAHNNNTMFHAVNAAIFEYQANCNHKSCAFIQWHGMAETTCPICSAFVSAGVSNHTAIYKDSRIPAVKRCLGKESLFDCHEKLGNRVIDIREKLLNFKQSLAEDLSFMGEGARFLQLAAAFDGIEGVGRACTPLESACKLVASTNVFGRLVNGVAREDVCTRRSVVCVTVIIRLIEECPGCERSVHACGTAAGGARSMGQVGEGDQECFSCSAVPRAATSRATTPQRPIKSAVKLAKRRSRDAPPFMHCLVVSIVHDLKTFAHRTRSK